MLSISIVQSTLLASQIFIEDILASGGDEVALIWLALKGLQVSEFFLRILKFLGKGQSLVFEVFHVILESLNQLTGERIDGIEFFHLASAALYFYF